ncbi:hypothetical protein J3R82DRAFT_3305 [Butyriboletus roseoflavus]|nr:hypothetical protein J3R82DRAFT_3305 [Butyriboletus roseoflavus]
MATFAPLPARFSTIKKDLLRDMDVAPDVLQLAWKGVLKALEPRVQEIISQGGNIIPRISYRDIEAGLSESQKDTIRKTGVVVITGGIPKEVSNMITVLSSAIMRPNVLEQLKEALKWKLHIKDYIAANPVKGVTLL